MALPLAVTVFVYIRIAKISWTLSNQLEPGEYLNPEKAELRRRRKKEMKWVKTIGKKNLTANRQKRLFFTRQRSKM